LQFLRKDEYREYFVKRFGIDPAVMEKYSFWQREKSVWAFSGELRDVGDIEILGVRALRIGK
jgi:hypothetical protein